MALEQLLDFGPRRGVLQHQRDMLRLDTGNAHVARERLPGDDDGDRFLEPQDREERLGAIDVAHNDGQMVEMRWHLRASSLVHDSTSIVRGSSRLRYQLP